MAMKWHGNEVTRYVQGASKAAEERAAELVLERAQAECPVDTGKLRASGYVADTIEEHGVAVTFSMPYASYVHDGTNRQPPNPFLARAIMQTEDDVKAIFAADMKAALDGNAAGRVPETGDA